MQPNPQAMATQSPRTLLQHVGVEAHRHKTPPSRKLPALDFIRWRHDVATHNDILRRNMRRFGA
jgi:hypothetical protein